MVLRTELRRLACRHTGLHSLWRLMVAAILAVVASFGVSRPSEAQSEGEQPPLDSHQSHSQSELDPNKRDLSPYWGQNIQRWSTYIAAVAEAYGFDPDFVAAIIKHESDGDHSAVSYMGAVGLMGVMPTGPGLEWRPSSDDLLTPATNLRWGMAILSYVVRQSGGDLFTALAAYNGGWDHVNSRVPREYAMRVLDSYARAVVARDGIEAASAAQWTIAVEIPKGNVPSQPMLILGRQPISELRLFSEHTVFKYVDDDGHAYYVRGYAVPVGLSDMIAQEPAMSTDAYQLEPALLAYLGDKASRTTTGNQNVLLACLPSLTRLRGEINTRWYAPSDCPAIQR